MFKKFIAGATVVAATAGVLAVAAPSAQASSKPANAVAALVERSDNNRGDSATDRRWWDHDILVAAAVELGLAEALADKGVVSTVFAPNDFAFRALVADLTGQRVVKVSEEAALAALLDIAALENVNGTGFTGVQVLTETILYHGTAEEIPNLRVRNRDSAPVQTLTGLPETLSDGNFDLEGRFFIRLADNDPDDRDPRFVGRTIKADNSQTVHVINGVLRPLPLEILFPGE